MLVNRFVLSDPCVTDESEMKFFAVFLSGTLLRVYVLSKIFLLDKIFEIFEDGPTLGSSVSFAIMERTVVLRSGMGIIMLLRFQTLHSGLTLDSFVDVLDLSLIHI